VIDDAPRSDALELPLARLVACDRAAARPRGVRENCGFL